MRLANQHPRMRRGPAATRLERWRRRFVLYVAVLCGALAVPAIAIEWARLAGGDQRMPDPRVSELLCLAENIYYEARGEPLVGQYAVAEVTLNRVRSPDFPGTVCDVVHQRGAFSWTYAAALPQPDGYEWRRARAVAGSVYDNLEAPLADGALFYHATYVSPDWARTRQQVALIGRHLFYR